MDDHAQQEIQDYAKVMYELVKPEVPIASEAFEDYSLNSVSLSRMELSALKCAVSTNMMQHTSDMSKREWKEFLEKFE
jgi:thymidylate synthase (FAD)